jgi:amino acid adenylation domain-containing protein
MSLDRSDGRSLRTGFLRNAQHRPDAPAVVVQGETLKYGDMDELARRLAGVIIDRIGRRAERVGVFAHRSATGYVGTMAALYAGATFVPLNRRFPVARTRTMIRRGALDALIVDAASAAQLADVLGGLELDFPVIAPDPGTVLPPLPSRCGISAPEVAAAAPLTDLPAIVQDDIAYLLFTSGTTGEPKGVPVTHGNTLHCLDAIAAYYVPFTSEDRFSQNFDQTFDVSVFDLFAAWEAGARVCVPQSSELLAPATYVNAHGVTIWFSVPSLPAYMRRAGQLRPGAMPTIRASMFAGEALPLATAEAWQAAVPNSVMINMYGPTETTIVCSGYRWNAQRSPAECVNDLVPLGKMFPGIGVVVVDEDLRAVAEREAGELCVAGPQTAPGYWRDTARTAERFVELAIGPVESRRFYRTGDRVRRMPSGDYVFLGRVDHQIKVHGNRIELAEVEAVMMQQEGVVSAAAIGWPLEDGRPQGLVGFAAGIDIDVEALRCRLRERLPVYMIPSTIVELEAMPLNANGKIDRAALQQMVPPRSDQG